MRNFDVARVWGIPIRVNISLLVFLPVLAWLIGSGTQIDVYVGFVNTFSPIPLDVADLKGGLTPWVIGFAAGIGLFVSVAIHELGHAYAAKHYGVETEAITLWLLGGLASLASIPREPRKELVIALAGPAGSVLTAFACYLAVLATPQSAPVVVFVFGWLVVTNGVLVGFNLLPAFPMDGGRVLRALLARSMPYGRATRIAARIGTLFAILFAIVGVLSFSPLLVLLAFFIYGAATGESRTVALDDLLDGLTVSDIAPPERTTIDADASIDDLYAQMARDRRTEYAVVDDGTVVGAITLAALREVNQDARAATSVREVMTDDLPTIGVDDDAFDSLVAMDEARARTAFVLDDSERVGVISRDDFGAVLQWRKTAGAQPLPTKEPF